MSERKYSVREIDELRKLMNNKYLYGAYYPPQMNGRVSRSFDEAGKSKAVEEMVRTAMLNGHTAEDFRRP